MNRIHMLKYDREFEMPSWIGSLHDNGFLIDDEEIVSLILLSLRSMLRRLLRYVNADVELKWFGCVWFVALWFRPKPLCVAVRFKLLLFILLLLLLPLFIKCMVDVDVVPVDDVPEMIGQEPKHSKYCLKNFNLKKMQVFLWIARIKNDSFRYLLQKIAKTLQIQTVRIHSLYDH